MKVSVLIPSYNHRHFIGETLRSIWQQPYRDVEIVVVDDCSTDGSQEIIEELRQQSPMPMVVRLRQENRGALATLD